MIVGIDLHKEKLRAFNKGAQSRQVEIDELQKRVKELELINFDSELHFDAAKEHIDCLQERISEALGVIYSEKSKVECDVYQGVDADLIIGIGYDLHLILKGNQND